MNDQELLYEVAKLAEFDACGSIWWRCDDGKLKVFVSCGDVFHWGFADLEEITEHNLPILRRSVEDVAAIAGSKYANQDDGFTLFCARVRGMRPQGAIYPHLTVKAYNPGPLNSAGNPTRIEDEALSAERTAALRALFDAAGPQREIDMTNPKDQDGVYRFQTAEDGEKQ